jgi:hypothetical protein
MAAIEQNASSRDIDIDCLRQKHVVFFWRLVARNVAAILAGESHPVATW